MLAAVGPLFTDALKLGREALKPYIGHRSVQFRAISNQPYDQDDDETYT